VASRYSGFGSVGSRPRRGARAAIRANRAASGFSRKRSRRHSSRRGDKSMQNAVGGAPGVGLSYHVSQ
jgi:hypothetical protein